MRPHAKGVKYMPCVGNSFGSAHAKGGKYMPGVGNSVGSASSREGGKIHAVNGVELDVVRGYILCRAWVIPLVIPLVPSGPPRVSAPRGQCVVACAEPSDIDLTAAKL